MASAEASNGGSEHHQHTVVVEMVVSETADAPPSTTTDTLSNEITPLLSPNNTPKINIFSPSYRRRKPREQVTKLTEVEISIFSQFISWVWGGSRYSGVLCMAFSSTIYCIMGAISETFTAQPIPLFETAFTRCIIILILSYLWLQRSGQPIFGPVHVRKLFFARAVTGFLSLLCFIYCIQSLPISQAIVLSFSTPIMASITARFIFHEKLKIAEIGGLACSFFGVLFIFRPILATRGEASSGTYVKGSYHLYTLLLGLFSSVSGGVSYCLIRAGAKASDQPVVTVFLFGLLASPAAAACTFVFQDFVFPSLYSLVLMIILGVLAFLAEVLLARGLHLEKTSKVVNIQYIEAALFQLWGIGSSRIAPSFGRISGCLLILISVCCTMYFGPEKETE
ncbi:hypothetical protein Ancab_010884 [Ancistrocladus abbreviatus]